MLIAIGTKKSAKSLRVCLASIYYNEPLEGVIKIRVYVKAGKLTIYREVMAQKYRNCLAWITAPYQITQHFRIRKLGQHLDSRYTVHRPIGRYLLN